MSSERSERYQTISDRYAQFRPRYPDRIVRAIADRLAKAPAKSGLPVLDVGSGTGIFTQQLAAVLAREIPIVGIEPSSAMRQEAASAPIPPSVSYREGRAENLPVEDGAARGIVAATAAHWFDRPAFYREASRVLVPGGVMTIVEYVRDERSAAARAMIDFLGRHGEARAYDRPDYEAELHRLPDFIDIEEEKEQETLLLSVQQFAGLALSSSHARKVIEDLGQSQASERPEAIGAALADDQGMVPFGYVFQAFLARRA